MIWELDDSYVRAIEGLGDISIRLYIGIIIYGMVFNM